MRAEVSPNRPQEWQARVIGYRVVTLCALTWLVASVAPAKPDLGKVASKYRELSYRPVPHRLVSSHFLKTYVAKELDREIRGPEARRVELFFQHLGLLPPGRGLKQTYKAVMEDQVRGLYDSRKKTYFVLQGGAAAGSEALFGKLFAWMGVNVEDMLTVHELDHAIQDQHFNLQRLQNSVRGNLDRELALQALVEGDAMSVMTDYTFAQLNNLQARSRRDGINHGTMSSGALNAAPRYFRDVLAFSYFQGQVFVDTLREEGGWELVNRAYQELPASSEQILHPSKWPTEKPLPVKLRTSAPQGYRSLGQDTAGEFVVRVWGREHDRWRGLAAGWGGDRFEVFEAKSGSQVVWLSRWDSLRDAQEFDEFARTALPKARVQRSGDTVTIWSSKRH